MMTEPQCHLTVEDFLTENDFLRDPQIPSNCSYCHQHIAAHLRRQGKPRPIF
jgi:hypothetical protein